MHFYLAFKSQFISAIKLYILYKWKVYTLLWHEYKYCIQSVHQKCLELHNIVPIFLKIFWGRTPDPPPPLSLIFILIKMSPTSVWYHPLLKSKKKKKKMRPPPPPFFKSWIRHWFHIYMSYIMSQLFFVRDGNMIVFVYDLWQKCVRKRARNAFKNKNNVYNTIFDVWVVFWK